MPRTNQGYVPLYLLGIAYAAISYYGGEGLALLTVALIGIPALFYLFMLAFAYALAAVAGWRSAGPGTTLPVAFPCVALFALITPIASAKHALGVPVPWLAVGLEDGSKLTPSLPTHLTAIMLVFALCWYRGRRKQLRATESGVVRRH